MNSDANTRDVANAKDAGTATKEPRRSTKAKLKELIVEYGWIALLTWLGIFGLTWSGFAIGLMLGLDVESTAGNAGIVASAYAATQLTKPIRIIATFALTPVIARVVGRMRGRKAAPDEAG